MVNLAQMDMDGQLEAAVLTADERAVYAVVTNPDGKFPLRYTYSYGHPGYGERRRYFLAGVYRRNAKGRWVWQQVSAEAAPSDSWIRQHRPMGRIKIKVWFSHPDGDYHIVEERDSVEDAELDWQQDCPFFLYAEKCKEKEEDEA